MSNGETIIKKNDNCAGSSVLESEQKIADFINFKITAVFQETPNYFRNTLSETKWHTEK